MTTIAVTGATGQLGRLVVAALLNRGVPAQNIIAAVRTPEKAADLAGRGVQVRRADYTQPETLAPALQGAERMLLISSSSPPANACPSTRTSSTRASKPAFS